MRRLASFFLVSLLAACGGGGGGGGGTGGAGGTDGVGPSTCEQPPSQILSQPCCLELGIDACGANLFCAAFDGRLQPTCYPERSRLDKQSCTEDRHCMSGSCNVKASACRSMPGTSCGRTIGCAPDAAGGRYTCEVETNTCRRVGDGSFGALCLEASDCDDQFTCGADGTCAFEGAVCGEVTGRGPCINDPDGAACESCRMGALQCTTSCWSEVLAVYNCGEPAGCISRAGGTGNFDCLLRECYGVFCDLEGCAADKCSMSGCY